MEVSVDLDFDVESVEAVSDEPAHDETSAPGFGAFQADAMVSFSPATGFGSGFGSGFGVSSGMDSNAFGSPPSAMDDVSNDSTKPVLAAFTDAFADAPVVHAFEMPAPGPALDQGPDVNPWEMTGPSFSAESDRAPSSAFPIPPATPSPEPFAKQAMSPFLSVPEESTPDSMASHPTRNVAKAAQQALAAARASLAPAAATEMPVASWETNPTMAISAADAHALLASEAVAAPVISPAAGDIAPTAPEGLSAAPLAALADLPAPPMMNFSTDDGLPAPPPLSVFLAETRAPFLGLGMSIEAGPAVGDDDLPAPPEMDFSVPALDPAWFSDPPATGPIDEASFADVSFDDLRAAGHPPAAAFGAGGIDDLSTSMPFLDQSPSVHQPSAAFETLPPTASLSSQAFDSNNETSPAPTEVPVPRGPPLSSRVGILAESLEEAGSIAEAALLYEVQATLNTMGL